MNADVANPFQSSFEGETYESFTDNNTGNNGDSDNRFMCEKETRIFIQKKTEILVTGNEQEQVPVCSPISDLSLYYALNSTKSNQKQKRIIAERGDRQISFCPIRVNILVKSFCRRKIKIYIHFDLHVTAGQVKSFLLSYSIVMNIRS